MMNIGVKKLWCHANFFHLLPSQRKDSETFNGKSCYEKQIKEQKKDVRSWNNWKQMIYLIASLRFIAWIFQRFCPTNHNLCRISTFRDSHDKFCWTRLLKILAKWLENNLWWNWFLIQLYALGLLKWTFSQKNWKDFAT